MTADLRVVHDAPPLLAGLIAQEVGPLATITCPTCDGEGIAYAHSTSPRKTSCRECWGEKTVQVPAWQVEPATPCDECSGRQSWQQHDGAVYECSTCTQEAQPEPCRLCRGRGDIEDPESGGDFTCWQCSGSGEQPSVVTA